MSLAIGVSIKGMEPWWGGPGVSSGESENPRVGVLGLTIGQPWESVFGEAVGESEHRGQPRVLVGSSQDDPGDRSFPGIIPGAEEWDLEVH